MIICRKLRYHSPDDAFQALSECRTKAALGNQRRRESGLYRCPRCQGWHLTSTVPPTNEWKRSA